jgi:hypothetical protein
MTKDCVHGQLPSHESAGLSTLPYFVRTYPERKAPLTQIQKNIPLV